MKLNHAIIEAMNAIVETNERLARAQTNLQAARRDETAAINAANEVQRKFDALVADVRSTAARSGTEWQYAKQPPKRVAE